MNQPLQHSLWGHDFGALAMRYVDLVYAAALRQLRGDVSAAQDATQAVMLVMLEKGRAGRLPEEGMMAGWLLKVTRYVVLQTKRAGARRGRHEAEAGRIAEAQVHTPHMESDVRAALDDALLLLSSIDREVVVRRYLRDESLAEVGRAVGISENTAGHRVARAMDRLRRMLARRGVKAPLVVVAGVMGAEAAIKAPSVCAAGVMAGQIAATGNSVSLAKGALLMLATKKIALACTVIIILMLGVGTTWYAAAHWGGPDGTRTPVFSDASNPTGTAQASLPIQFSNGTVVELCGIHQEPIDQTWTNALSLATQPSADAPWWGANGMECSSPPHEDKPRVHFTMDGGERLMRFMLELRGPAGTGINVAILPGIHTAYSGYSRNGANWIEVVAAVPADVKSADVQIGVAGGTWVNDITYDVAAQKFTTSDSAEDEIDSITLTQEKGETCVMSIGQPAAAPQRDHQFIVKVGSRTLQLRHGHGDFKLERSYFNCAPGDVTQVIYQSRSYEVMVVKNVSLIPSTTPTNVEVAPAATK